MLARVLVALMLLLPAGAAAERFAFRFPTSLPKVGLLPNAGKPGLPHTEVPVLPEPVKPPVTTPTDPKGAPSVVVTPRTPTGPGESKGVPEIPPSKEGPRTVPLTDPRDPIL